MLRTHIPSAVKHKKMSKVDTLRHAVEYIQSLQRMLNRNSSSEDDMDEEDTTESIKLETPISPPPEEPAFINPSHQFASDDGYETSSYYCNGMICPVPH